MPVWVLVCRTCGSDFKWWDIDDRSLRNYLMPTKPEFAVDGVATKCPNCGNDAIYAPTDLRYRSFR